MSNGSEGTPEYRIEFAIQRADCGSDDFVEVGFGSSGTWEDLDACTHMIASMVTHGEWETEAGQPDPDVIMAEIRAAGIDVDGGA